MATIDELKPVYYYLRDKNKRPLVTVCLLVDPDHKEVVSRGVAICGPLDMPAKKVGRGMAYGRALRAAKRNIPWNEGAILRGAACRVMHECGVTEKIYWKEMSSPTLTPLEADIIGRMFRAGVTEGWKVYENRLADGRA
jgi:hypothetical protein